MLAESLTDAANELSERIVALRRAIHAEPELGLFTPKTRDKVRAALAHLPLEWREGPSTTGLVAVLKGGDGVGRCVLLRGDMDALPMPEETGLPFASTIPGTMHACGHDAHTAMLAGAVELLAARREQLAGEVRFMFQPGEEGYHGAKLMLDDGLLGGTGGEALPGAAFALHVMPNAPHGLIGGRAGPLMAAADQLDVVIEGRGGHASMPHQTLDPVPVAAEVVTALQSMVTRKFDAADAVVVTITQIHAGTAHNVIADRVEMTGTMRSLSPGNRARLHDLVKQLVAGIVAAHGLTAQVTITEGFPVTVCDAAAVAFGEKVARQQFGDASFYRMPAPIMGAEDFAYVLEKVAGAMFFLGFAHQGADWAQCCGIHSTRMMLDESVMPRGAAYLAALGERFLAEGFA